MKCACSTARTWTPWSARTPIATASSIPTKRTTTRTACSIPGVLEYFTVYSREPNTNSNGSARINIAQPQQFVHPVGMGCCRRTSARHGPIRSWAVSGCGRAGPAGSGWRRQRRGAAAATRRFTSPLQFYVRSGMTCDRVRRRRHQSHDHDRARTSRAASTSTPPARKCWPACWAAIRPRPSNWSTIGNPIPAT